MRGLFSRFFGKRNQFRRCNGFAIFASVTCLDQDMENGAEFYRRFVRIEEVMRQAFESAKPSQHGRAMASFKIVWENCELEERTKVLSLLRSIQRAREQLWALEKEFPGSDFSSFYGLGFGEVRWIEGFHSGPAIHAANRLRILAEERGRLLGVQTEIVKFLRPKSAWNTLPVDNPEMRAVLLTAEELDQLVQQN